MQKFKNKILIGDCIDILSQASEPFADLVFADPPFNIGFQYDKYHDKVEKNNYLAWTRDWMAACLQALKPNGSFYIAIGDEYAANVRLIGEELGLTLRNWIIWYYTFGQQTKMKFARSHAHIFYFVRDPKDFTFNDRAIRVPSDRQLVYNDKRAQTGGKMPDDVWSAYSRVCGTFKEREGWHPCQMPELLLARIIAVSSNPGDLVFDPFNGSGTTAAAALQMGRHYCATDISDSYVENTRRRLEEISNNGQAVCGFSAYEFLELKRLFVEIGIPAKEYQENPKLFEIFLRQFSYRINHQKEFDPDQVQAALSELSTWVVRK